MTAKSLTRSAIASLKPKANTYEVRDTKVKGFLVRVRPSGSISFIVQYRDVTGTQRNYTIGIDGDGWNATTAREKAEDIRYQAERGKDPHYDKRTSKQEAINQRANTLRVYFEGDYQFHLETKKLSSQNETRRIVFSEFENLLDIPLSNITTQHIRNWRSYRRKNVRKGKLSTRPLSEETLKRYNAEIDVLLQKALEDGFFTEHPLRGKIKPIKGANRKNVKARFFSKEESNFFLEALEERDIYLLRKAASGRQWKIDRKYALGRCRANDRFADHLSPMCIVSLNTGIRQGELFQLEWRDIAEDYSTIELRDETTKAKMARSLPLNKSARSALVDWRAQTAHTNDSLVFPNSNGEVFQDVKSHWYGLIVRWKVKFKKEPTNFRWHDMRHDFASQLVMGGVPLNTVRVLLGHATLEMTLRYAHLADKSLSDAVATLNI